MRALELMATDTSHPGRRVAPATLAVALDTGVGRIRHIQKVRRSVRARVQQFDHPHGAVGRKPAATLATFRAERVAARGLAPLADRHVTQDGTRHSRTNLVRGRGLAGHESRRPRRFVPQKDVGNQLVPQLVVLLLVKQPDQRRTALSAAIEN